MGEIMSKRILSKIIVNDYTVVAKVANPIYDFYKKTEQTRGGNRFNNDKNGNLIPTEYKEDFVHKPRWDGDKHFGKYALGQTFYKLDKSTQGRLTDFHEMLYHEIHPAINKFNDIGIENDISGSVFVTEYTSKMFHSFMELIPRLIHLKKIDPDFILVLIGDQSITNEGLFSGLSEQSTEKKDQNSSYLKFFIDLLKINTICINVSDMVEDFNEISADYGYLFYDKKPVYYTRAYSAHEQIWSKELNIDSPHVEYDHYHMYYTLPEPQDFTAIEEMRKFFEQYRIPTTDKKIYISRKNFDRGFSNEKQIESYMTSLGYEICYPENLNPIDQYKLYVSSKEIVCLIGSSIVNALLCTDSSTVKIIGHEDPNDPNMFSSMSRVWTDFLNKFEIPNSLYEIPKDYDDEKIDKFLKDNFK
jgi:hypothetical protein